MAREIKRFEAFGATYQTTQFAAVRGLQLMGVDGEVSPADLLSATQVLVGSDWIELDNRDAINIHVKDVVGVLPGLLVVKGLCSVVSEFNFSFLDSWKGIKVPGRFLSEGATVSTKYSEPLVSSLIAGEVCSLRELEEYYSLEDAFKQFDILMAKGVNDALASEAASKKSPKG